MSNNNKVKLRSSEGEMFEVDEQVANQSETVKKLIEELGTEGMIPLPNVEAKILAKVIEYCKYHVESEKNFYDGPAIREYNIKQWDEEFVNVEQAMLHGLVRAANYLNIKNLLYLTCQTVSNMFVGKTREEIRKKFNITDDFTPEE